MEGVTLAEGGAAVAFATLAMWTIRTQFSQLERKDREIAELSKELRDNLKDQIETMAVAIAKIGGGDA